MNTINGELLESTSNHYDLMSSLEHEKAHKDAKEGTGYGMKYAEFYFQQTKGDYFANTTKEYKTGIVASMLQQLTNSLAYYDKENEKKVLTSWMNSTNKIQEYWAIK